MKAKLQKNRKPNSIHIEECPHPKQGNSHMITVMYVDSEKSERHYDFFYYPSFKDAEREKEELEKIIKKLYFSQLQA